MSPGSPSRFLSTDTSTHERPELILLTGATGYVGGRLLRALEAGGRRVRCLARRPEVLASRVAPSTEVVRGDVLDPASLDAALRGVHTAYYLVHSMGIGPSFVEQDRAAARHFAKAAREAGVQRVIYLGGLGDGAEDLSPHLRSRHEVGDILRQSGVEVIEFRASIVIGSGSLSFEMIRALVERLPVMITPRWVRVMAQPIGIQDLIAFLDRALDLPPQDSAIFEIGGTDQVSYGELMEEYARQRGLRRWMIPVPVLTPRLSSLWLGLVTPVYARVGRALVESLRHPTVVKNPGANEIFGLRPKNMRDAMAEALRNEDQEIAQTRWCDAYSSAQLTPAWGGTAMGTRLIDSRAIVVPVPPEQAFAPIRRLGGATGWYFANSLWKLRGAIDLLAGGVGLRRGRRDPENLAVGDALDFWRVEQVEAPRLLRLAAEMKVPGRAWLQFEVVPEGPGARIRQTAIFDAVGLAGLLYWYGIYPLHALVFERMLRAIGRRAGRPTPDKF